MFTRFYILDFKSCLMLLEELRGVLRDGIAWRFGFEAAQMQESGLEEANGVAHAHVQ